MTTLVRTRASRRWNAHRTWPAIAVLAVLAVVSPFAALCFGDGHVAVEAMLAPHQLASGSDQIGSPASRAEATSHGPCVDGLIESAIREGSGCPRMLDAGLHDFADASGRSDRAAPGFVPDRWARIGAVDPIALPPRSLRGTVLRI